MRPASKPTDSTVTVWAASSLGHPFDIARTAPYSLYTLPRGGRRPEVVCLSRSTAAPRHGYALPAPRRTNTATKLIREPPVPPPLAAFRPGPARPRSAAPAPGVAASAFSCPAGAETAPRTLLGKGGQKWGRARDATARRQLLVHNAALLLLVVLGYSGLRGARATRSSGSRAARRAGGRRQRDSPLNCPSGRCIDSLCG